MLSKEERAYRRGALQSIQFLKRILDDQLGTPTHIGDLYIGLIAEWEQALVNARVNQDLRYFGTYLDTIMKELNRCTSR